VFSGDAFLFCRTFFKSAIAFGGLSVFEVRKIIRWVILQELKNLRPQLYSAAEYCEKSYLHSEQKQT
jgi:hypothetical protein